MIWIKDCYSEASIGGGLYKKVFFEISEKELHFP